MNKANHPTVGIVGGSLAGLAAANVLLRTGANVTVFEKSQTGFGNRGACLGFVDVDMLEKIRGETFTRNGRRASLNQGAFYYGDVWEFLYSGLPDGCVRFGQEVRTLGDVNKPTVDGEAFDLVIVADGGWSSLRARYIDSRQPEYTGHQIIWASVDTAELAGGLRSFESEFGSTETATYSNGCYDAVVLEAPKCDGSHMYACGFFVATPESEIVAPRTGDNRQVEATRAWSTPPEWFLPFVRSMFGKYVDGDIVRFAEAAVAKGKIAPNPVYEYAARTTVCGRIVAMGDAVHLATPWTAAGAHTALIDAVRLGEALTQSTGGLDRALRSYDKGAVALANSLLAQSRACSRRLLPSAGKRGIPSPAALAMAVTTATPRAVASYNDSPLAPPVQVTVGTSASNTHEFCSRVSTMVNAAYGHHRLSSHEVSARLALGDGAATNRVLHLAWRGGALVGCCSSTLAAPWCPPGCGHWGLLVVDVSAQGTGVGSALVAAAEARLAQAGLPYVQIEYGYTCGDVESERLLAWYEGSLGYDGGGRPCSRPGSSEFRRCWKRLCTAPARCGEVSRT